MNTRFTFTRVAIIYIVVWFLRPNKLRVNFVGFLRDDDDAGSVVGRFGGIL